MKKRKRMVIAIAIALAVACTHHSIKKEKIRKQLPVKEALVPYLPSVLIDMSFFPCNLFLIMVNYL